MGDAALVHDEVLINSAPGAGALRRGDWKLVLNGHRHFKDGAPGPKFSWADLLKKDGLSREEALREQIELFNLRDDPGETRNLASAHPDKVRELTARYERYAREAMASAFRILGEGQLSLTKFLLVTDRRVDLKDFRATLEHVLARTPALRALVYECERNRLEDVLPRFARLAELAREAGWH